MDFRQLVTFRMVATTLSFTRTAALMNYAQSSVTAQIQALEDDLGLPLFNRLGRQVTLTDAGSILFRYAEKILDLTEEARAAVTGGESPSGSLVIGAPETICTYRLPPILRRFQQAYPDIRLTLRPFPYSELHRSIREGVVDIAFMLEQPFQSSFLMSEILCAEPLVVIAAPDHPLAGKPCVETLDLESEPILMTGRGCGYRRLFEQELAAAGLHPDTSLEFDSVEAIKQCVMSGLGVAMLPAVAVAREIAAAQLVALRWGDPDLQVSTQVAWHKDRWVSPALQAFIETSRAVMRTTEAVP